MEKKSIITVKELQVSYQDKTVLTDVNLHIPENSRTAIVGPNGAGKSTLIKAILNLVKPDKGEIKIMGKSLNQVSKKIAYVPQRSGVNWDFPATVFDVVMMGRYAHLSIGKRPTEKDKEIVIEALEEMGMLEFKDRQISQLSGGQKQRVFLARALAQQVDLYILDEPLTGVDTTTEEIIIKKFKQLQDEGKTVVAVHHNLMTLNKYFDYLIVLNNDVKVQGEMLEVNTPENLEKAYRI
ncbi:metal ABC transporter ATP-binding protein [Helcococcus sueciensis]|uniref:metal ABC transporter ATP-binding protein n=1 Tax=Helcococcus sueciensis TaxID=241555 RepID=UPI000412E80B|nr:ABC transporter ATP-binding protein [Helcococcus sueciensis]